MSEPQQEVPPAGDKQLSKEEKKAAKAAAKAAKLAAKAEAAAAREAEAKARLDAEMDEVADRCGAAPLNQSQSRDGATFAEISALGEAKAGDEIMLRARLHSVRSAGNLVFVVLRQQSLTMQALLSKSDAVPKAMLKFVGKANPESIVDVSGVLREPEQAPEGVSFSGLELDVRKFFVVSAAQAPLPFALVDAMLPAPAEAEYKAQVAEARSAVEKAKEEGGDVAAAEAALDAVAATCRPVARPTRLDNRVLDLRTPANQAIFRIQSGICRLFREHLTKLGFMEVQTPKLIGCLSEGGANVFEVSYFGRKAYLAQSPQFYKQMCIAADFERVFEVAPVFRAEDSNTPRHMTEFIGLDLEMAFKEHYHEVLDTLDTLFEAIFVGLETQHKHDIEIVSQQYPVEPFRYKFPSPRIDFADACEMLKAAGVEQSRWEDLSTENERALGKIIAEKYDTDFYQLDRFPADARPFYTMLDKEDPRVTNSYDFMMRGQEILSGAQRVHDYDMLLERAKVKEVDLESVEGYTSSFKHGVPPHGGGGIGLNRVGMLFLGLDHITKTTLYPRLPRRLYP